MNRLGGALSLALLLSGCEQITGLFDAGAYDSSAADHENGVSNTAAEQGD